MKHKIATLIVVMGLFLATLILSACAPKNPFRLMDPGKYQFGTDKSFEFTDTSRDNRIIRLHIWYPALLPSDGEPSKNHFDAEPDFDNAPYPLILSSAKTGMIFGPHLATHGFVVVGVDGQEPHDRWGQWLIDYPRDQVFVLEQISGESLEGLNGMIDFENAGAMGYSFDGYDALALGGARIDPDFYLQQCSNASPSSPAPEPWWIDYICSLEGGWEEFESHATPDISESSNGLWQPITDDRIRAVMPMAPEGAWLFGKSGLAAVDRPVLIIAATGDVINYYDMEAAAIFDLLGTTEKTMVSFIDQDHMMIFDDDQVAVMKHFAVAFFGYFLQAREDYAFYFSEEFISTQENLAWGTYSEK